MITLSHGQRRAASLVAAALAAALTLAGCSTTEDVAGASTATADGDASTTVAPVMLAEEGAFPVTVDHAYGATTVDAEPQRVVTIGWSAQDAVLALGKVPVGIERFTGSGIVDDILPWDSEYFVDATPELLTSNPEVPFEQIMALEPDIIVAVYSGIEQSDYDRLSEIAPTIAFPEVAWSTPWQEQTTMIGAALGQPARADELVTGVADTLAATREANPGLSGKTITYAMAGEDVIVFCPNDPRIEMLVDIGMVPSAGTEQACAGGDASSVIVSPELVDTLDADAFVLVDVDDTVLDDLMQDDLFANLPSVVDGRVVQVIGMDYAMATSAPTVLSIPYALDEFVSQLTDVLG